MTKLTDPKVNGKYPFTYTPAAATDLAATFKRVRQRERESAGNSGSTITMLRKGDKRG